MTMLPPAARLLLLAGAAVLASAGDAPAAPALIPDGLHIEVLDHLHSTSEPLLAACKAGEGTQDLLAQGLRFTVTALDGTVVADGISKTSTRESALAVFRLCEPVEGARWPEGWYDLRTVAMAGGKELSMKFRHLARPGAARVVYLLDNLTPEGYAEWLNQGCTAAIEPLKSFPESVAPDLVVMSHWAPLSPAQSQRLDAYVSGGGTLLMFGDNTATADVLSPLRIDRADPYRMKPVAITGVTAGSGLDLAAWQGAQVEVVNAILAEGATAWAATGSRPFLASKARGTGMVLATTAPLKPGLVYDRLVRSLLKIRDPLAKPAAMADADGFREGISGGRNVGRFGWTNSDRINEIGIQADRSFRMWDVAQDSFRVDFPPFSDVGAGRLTCLSADWLGKRLLGSGGVFGTRTELYVGLGTPGVLYRNPEARAVRLRLGSVRTLAYPVSGGARTLRPAVGDQIMPEGMDRNWLLFWNGTAGAGSEWPLLVCVNRRIAGIQRISDDSWELSFASGGVDLAVMPLGGIRHADPALVRTWDPLPADLIATVDWWSRVQSRRAIACREDYRLDPARREVEIRDRYTYLTLINDWGIPGLEIAPVPPLLPLAIANGTARTVSPLIDTGVATFCGPFHAASGSSVVYRLPVPDLSYPLPTRPTDPGLADPLQRDLFERICEHAALPNNVYLPVGFMPIELKPGQIHPDRDLQPATFSKGTQEIRDKPFIDLHRNLGGTWGLILFKPFLDAVSGHEVVKDLIGRKIARNLLRDVGFFQYKTFLRYRTEPNAGGTYPMTFLGPVRFNDGYRIFHDMNETAAIVLYSCDAWAQVSDDAGFLAANRPYLEATAAYLTTLNDWAWMSSMAVEWGMGNNIDMLNAELPAWAAMQRIRSRLGDRGGADFAAYMAARAAISASARFFFGDYYNSLRFPDLLKLTAETHEMAAMGQQATKGGRFLPFGVANGYGEGWPSLWPNDLSDGYLTHNLVGIDIYNHSKGVCPDLLEAYRHPAVMRVLTPYEEAFRAANRKKGWPIGYSRIASYGSLSGDTAATRAELQRSLAHPGLTATCLGAGTADWEISSMAFLLDLLRTKPASP
jgi:hypothetical protein